MWLNRPRRLRLYREHPAKRRLTSVGSGIFVRMNNALIQPLCEGLAEISGTNEKIATIG
jgi:hypothetical protein